MTFDSSSTHLPESFVYWRHNNELQNYAKAWQIAFWPKSGILKDCLVQQKNCSLKSAILEC